MNRLEDRLRDAFSAAAETVQPDSVGGQRARPSAIGTRRLAPLAAAAAVAVIVIGASISVPMLLTRGNHGQPSSTGAGPSLPTASAVPSGAVVTVSNVLGMAVNQATAQLQAMGLQVTVLSGVSRTVPAGTVMAQSPAAGARAASGATVTMVVSAGASPSVTFSLEPSRLVTVAAYAVTIRIPQDWQPTPQLGPVVGYEGLTGWVQVQAVTDHAGVHAACAGVATQHDNHQYGSEPRIEYRSIDGRPGCLIIPSGDAPTSFTEPGGVALPTTSALVEYRSPITGGDNFLVISTDPPHLMFIVGSVQLHH
jgi:PASTA domain